MNADVEDPYEKVLLEHGHRVAEYKTDEWLQTLTQVRGRNLDFIFGPWLFIVAFSTGWTFLVQYKDISIRLSEAVSVVQATLAFLIIFRLARAAQRFWEARQAAGAIVASCRCLGSRMLAMGVEDTRWVEAFPVATKNYLRREVGDASELRNVEELIGKECQPLWCVDKTRKLACEKANSSALDAHMVAGIMHQLDLLTLHFGAMERIQNTPLPFAYVAHLRVFLVVFLMSIPVVYASSWKWGTPFAVALISFALLGIEGAAVECERPFAKDPNHFALEKFAVTVHRNLLQTQQCFMSSKER